MYSSFSPTRIFYQGDILKDTLFFIHKHIDGDKYSLIVKRITIMILSQTCDIQNRNFINIAPIISLSELKKTKTVNNDQIRSLQRQKTKYWFYLPEDQGDGFPESYVELTKITYISKRLLEKRNRIKSLSSLGRHWLTYKLNDFFGRPIFPQEALNNR